MVLEVTDRLSNRPEQLVEFANILGRSEGRIRVFEEIYRGQKKTKTVDEIAKKLNLPNKTVLTHGKFLSTNHLCKQDGERGQTFYAKIAWVQSNKTKILELTKDPKKRANVPTKRNIKVNVENKKSPVLVPSSLVSIEHVQLEDIFAFREVKNHAPSGMLGDALTEDQFKLGVQKLCLESGVFKDWGGEQSDLYTSALQFTASKKLTAAFAFKGPGLKTKLTIAKMGKNGDQCPRLFQEPAQFFVVQHCREVASAVIDLVHTHAALKSVYLNQRVYFSVWDGQASKRLVEAYPSAF